VCDAVLRRHRGLTRRGLRARIAAPPGLSDQGRGVGRAVGASVGGGVGRGVAALVGAAVEPRVGTDVGLGATVGCGVGVAGALSVTISGVDSWALPKLSNARSRSRQRPG